MAEPPNEPPENPSRSNPPRDRTKHAEPAIRSRPRGVSVGFQDVLDERARRRERAAAWIEKNWKGDPMCLVCRSNNWQIGDVYSLPPFLSRAPTIEAAFFPQEILLVFPVTCNVCGNTVFINAVASGVVNEEDES